VTITVAGRPAAVLGPIASRTWRQWADLGDLYREGVDGDWEADRERLDDALADPWAHR